MNELSEIKELSFEIGEDCNLKSVHKKCPVNIRKYNKKYGELKISRIIELIDEANDMGFNGYIAFHYYNEPLMYIDKIEKIISLRPNNKYLLWTNGTLLKKDIEKNKFLIKFSKVVITCYDFNRLEFYKNIKEHYKNVQIAVWDLDDRIHIYENEERNVYPCKRVLYEIPIDHYGNLHLCSEDWNNEYEIGNVINTSLKEIVSSTLFRHTRSMEKNGKLIEDCPLICKRCISMSIKEDFDIDNLKGCI